MKDCPEFLPLVEKLFDDEATAREKLEAESHLEKCPGCRSHAEFLSALAKEARSMSFPEPPPSYWQHLPRKVLDRIDAEGPRPFWSALVAPATLRWVALGAAFVAAVSVSLSVLRENSVAPAASPAVVQDPAAVAPAASEPPAPPPPMARDEAAPVAAESALSREAPAETASALESEAGVADSSERRESENFQSFARARAPETEAASPAVSSLREREDCDPLRRSVDSLAEGPPRAAARYRIALCSFESYERESTDERRKQAIEDAELFLAIEAGGPRAEEIRERLGGVRPDD